MKLAIFDAVQDPLGIEKEEFEDLPSTCTHQLGGSKPVVPDVCWGRPPVQPATCYPVEIPIGMKEEELEDLPPPAADNHRKPILRCRGWRWSFDDHVPPHTINGTVRVEEQVLKVGPACSPDQLSCCEPVVSYTLRRISFV